MINRLRAIFNQSGLFVHPVHSVFFLAAALPAILLLSGPAQAQFAGGSGTAEDPYQVQTLQQLQLIADSVYLNSHFIQVADIDASETELWNDGRGFRPIGWPEAPNGGRSFSGSYNGNGRTIGYLHIDRKEHDEIGLFGRVTGKLENMVLDSVRVSGNKNVGGLAGLLRGTAEHIALSGMVTGAESVGGLVGWVSGRDSKIHQANTDVVVSGLEDSPARYIGGLVGYAWDSRITASYSTGRVSGKRNVGGLIGWADEFNRWIDEVSERIRDVRSSAAVSGEQYIGGLIGLLDYGAVSDAHATGNVSGQGGIGGLIGGVGYFSEVGQSSATGNVSGQSGVGGLIGSQQDHSFIWESFATGNVSGHTAVGGLAGFGYMENSYSTGDVTGHNSVGGLTGAGGPGTWSFAAGKVEADGQDYGGLDGRIYCYEFWDYPCRATFDSYWDVVSTGQNSAFGSGAFTFENLRSHGLETSQMTGQNAYLHMYHLDFDNVWDLTSGYPVLKWQQHPDVLPQPEVSVIGFEREGRNFGEVRVDTTRSHRVIFRNFGNQPMQGQVWLEGPDGSPFLLTEGEGEYQLEPKATHEVRVLFQPEEPASYQAWLWITHDAANREDSVRLSFAGTGVQVTSATDVPETVTEFQLHQNYPNPFNPSTVIAYQIPEESHVRLNVYDVTGRRVSRLVDEVQTPGEYRVTWNASEMTSGIYIYRLSASGHTHTRRMALIR